jgi:TolA-binding protein
MMDEGAIQSLNEQIDDLWDAVDELKGSMMSESEKEELAAAETVEEIDKRLSEIEEEPADRKTLAEGSTDTDASWFEADGMTESDTRGL